jgi:hypothetical protein
MRMGGETMTTDEYIATALGYLAEAVERERQAGRTVAPWCIERAERLIRVLAEPPYVTLTYDGGVRLGWRVNTPDEITLVIRPRVSLIAPGWSP